MTKQQVEKHQVWFYLCVILIGLAAGQAVPDAARAFELMLWPVLGLLLYSVFTQTPIAHLPSVYGDARFFTAVLAGNFLLVPLLVWALIQWLPDDPAIRFGVLLVLLVPCTDWFIAFTQLGRGDTLRAIALTPVNLVAQFALLPVYLWLFLGEGFQQAVTMNIGTLGVAFTGLIVLPLILAFATQRRVEARPQRSIWLERLGRLPVPLLAVVVFLIAATQVNTVLGSMHLFGQVLFVFVGFLLAAGLLAWIVARLFRLDTAAGRTLAFSLGSRNSFVVLPLALALPPGWEIAAVVIVFQSLVELFGMMFYLWWVPRKLFPAAG